MPSRPAAPAVAALLLLSTLSVALFPPPASALSSSDLLPLPRMALGFNWTYTFAGATDVDLGGFHATYMTDTYTSQIVADASTPRGDAWVVRNNHSGTLSGTVPPGIPSTGTFTSLNFYHLRKSDLAILNSTQDISVTASVPPFGSVSGSGHNDTYADPPLAQIAFGSPADGTPWRILSNLTDTGWYKIGSSAKVNTFSYLALDYNLSVTAIETALVPAGSLPSYNTTGGGTANNNGTTYTFTQGFLYAPDALNKAVDESGYLLQAFAINRAPFVSGLPPLGVDAGASAQLDLTAYVSDPDGDPFSLTCAPAAPLNCSVAPNGTLSVTADPGVNATLSLNLTADDGRPAGNTTFPLTVLVTDLGNPNLPPVWAGPSTLTMTEDADSSFALSVLVSDPDDPALTYSLRPATPLIVLAENATHFTLHAPPNFNGRSTLNISVFDSAGNALVADVDVQILPVNDAPTIRPLTATDLFVHTFGNVTAAVAFEDVDGDPLIFGWLVDGDPPSIPVTSADFTYFSPAEDQGRHTLTAHVREGGGFPVTLDFTVHVFVGPALTFHTPSAQYLRVANGSTLEFEIRATDPDSPTLDYTWSSGSAILGQGPNATRLTLLVAQTASFQVAGVAADNGSFAGFVWDIAVEDVPEGLVSILAPTEAQSFPANSQVAVSALFDPRLSALNLSWSLDGVTFSHAEDATTALLGGPHNYTLSLNVTGLYIASIPYSARLTVNFSVLAPPPAYDSNGGGSGGTLPPAGGDLILPLILLAALVGAALALFLRQRRRRTPPA